MTCSSEKTTPAAPPALVGRTRRTPSRTTPRTDHPRVGGKKNNDVPYDRTKNGTPPRRREGLPRDRGCRDRGRTTPASAGSTSPPPTRPAVASDHPRVGGKHGAPVHAGSSEYGSPPRRREGHHSQRPGRPGHRTTPASTGRTTTPDRERPESTEHPRVGGKDARRICPGSPGEGTPPRRREGPVRGVVAVDDGRITPASAGRALPDLRLSKGFAIPLTWSRCVGRRACGHCIRPHTATGRSVFLCLL